MEGDDISLLDQIVEGAEVAFVAAVGTRGIAKQGFDTQRLQALLQPPADVTDADDPDGAIAQREAVTFGQHQQR